MPLVLLVEVVEWFIVSKVLERSINMADIFSSLSKSFFPFFWHDYQGILCAMWFPETHDIFWDFLFHKIINLLGNYSAKTFDMCGNKLTDL